MVERLNRAGRRVVFGEPPKSRKIILRQAQVVFRELPKLVVSLKSVAELPATDCQGSLKPVPACQTGSGDPF
jgi:hypothetical protein